MTEEQIETERARMRELLRKEFDMMSPAELRYIQALIDRRLSDGPAR